MINKKGFALTEVLVVTVFLVTIFTFVYASIIPLMGKYEDDAERVKDIDIVYKLYHIRKMIKNDPNHNVFLSYSRRNITCSDFANKDYCNNLMNQLELTNYSLYFIENLNYSTINSMSTSLELTDYFRKNYYQSGSSYLLLRDENKKTTAHLLYNYDDKFDPSSLTCTITTPSGYDTSKTLTIESSYRNVMFSWDGVNFDNENTKTINAAGTYNGYVKDVGSNTIKECSIVIKSRTEYRHDTRTSCKTCKYCSSGTLGGGGTWCYTGTKVSKPEGECSDDGWYYNSGDGKCYSNIISPTNGVNCNKCGCTWNTSDTTWYTNSCGSSSACSNTCKNRSSRTAYGT